MSLELISSLESCRARVDALLAIEQVGHPCKQIRSLVRAARKLSTSIGVANLTSKQQHSALFGMLVEYNAICDHILREQELKVAEVSAHSPLARTILNLMRLREAVNQVSPAPLDVHLVLAQSRCHRLQLRCWLCFICLTDQEAFDQLPKSIVARIVCCSHLQRRALTEIRGSTPDDVRELVSGCLLDDRCAKP